MEAAGGEIIIAGMPGVDYRTPIGRMVTGMMAVAGEVVSTSAQTRSKNIADSIMARGVPNRVPYGYRRNADERGVKTDPDRDGKALVPQRLVCALDATRAQTHNPPCTPGCRTSSSAMSASTCLRSARARPRRSGAS